MTKKNHVLRFPKPPAPELPRRLDGIALAEWQRVAPALRSMGRLERIFESSLEVYCTSFAMLRRMEAELARGGLKIHGAKSALKGMRRNVHMWALEFGVALDRKGRMNIARPLPLSTKYDQKLPPWRHARRCG